MEKEESNYTEEAENVLGILRRISIALKLSYRKPTGDRLLRFCTYFEGFDADRIESFISRISKSKEALNPDFCMDDIVTKDMVNAIVLSTSRKTLSGHTSSSFYSIQVMEV